MSNTYLERAGSQLCSHVIILELSKFFFERRGSEIWLFFCSHRMAPSSYWYIIASWFNLLAVEKGRTMKGVFSDEILKHWDNDGVYASESLSALRATLLAPKSHLIIHHVPEEIGLQVKGALSRTGMFAVHNAELQGDPEFRHDFKVPVLGQF